MSDWTEGYTAEIEYTTGFYRELTPLHLQLALQLQATRSADPNKPFTYFEIGCGQGFSTNLHAAMHPHAQFYANDFNPLHIANARTLAEQAGTKNVTFYEASFAETLARDDLPDFDFITLHGVYSWITAENRKQIVEFIRRKLKPGGVVYLSYNAFPGWSQMAPVRRLFTQYAKQTGGTLSHRMKGAFEFARKLSDAKAGYFVNNPSLQQRLDLIGTQDLNYVAHEYFNQEWNVLYFADVAAELADAKLNFVGSAHLAEQFDQFTVGDARVELLNSIGDPILRETAKDFIINQQFRRDVFARGAVKMNVAMQSALLRQMRFVKSQPSDKIDRKMKVPAGEVDLHMDTYQPLIDALSNGPKTLAEVAKITGREGEPVSKVFQNIAILASAGYVSPASNNDGLDKRRRAADVFNAIVFERSQSGENISFFASPVLGGAVVIDKFEQLMLWQSDRPGGTTVAKITEMMRERGQRLVLDGKAIEDEAAEKVEMEKRVDIFFANRLPLYHSLGVAIPSRK